MKKRLWFWVGVLAVALVATSAALAKTGDSPETAIDAVLNGTVQTSTNKYKTIDDSTPSCVDSYSHIAWFKWDATVTGTIHADTFGSSFDTVLVVFNSSLGEVACNDDFTFPTDCPAHGPNQSSGLCSSVEWSATSGQTYYLAVGSFGTLDGGKVKLTLLD